MTSNSQNNIKNQNLLNVYRHRPKTANFTQRRFSWGHHRLNRDRRRNRNMIKKNRQVLRFSHHPHRIKLSSGKEMCTLQRQKRTLWLGVSYKAYWDGHSEILQKNQMPSSWLKIERMKWKPLRKVQTAFQAPTPATKAIGQLHHQKQIFLASHSMAYARNAGKISDSRHFHS